MWKDFHVKEGHAELAGMNSLGSDPSYQLVAASNFALWPRLQLTVNARAVDELDRNPEIGSYVEAGGRLAWLATETLELYIAGRNLLNRRHAESFDPDQAQLAERSVYAGARVRF